MKADNSTICGFMVIIRNEHTQKFEADWDGEVHETWAAAIGEAVKAKQAGFDAFPVALQGRKIVEPFNG
jgi:hypothetical protein